MTRDEQVKVIDTALRHIKGLEKLRKQLEEMRSELTGQKARALEFETRGARAQA